jgi:hypothetical protein
MSSILMLASCTTARVGTMQNKEDSFRKTHLALEQASTFIPTLRMIPPNFTHPMGEKPWLIVGGVLVAEALLHSYLADRAERFSPPNNILTFTSSIVT